jgi:hypothetical protein
MLTHEHNSVHAKKILMPFRHSFSTQLVSVAHSIQTYEMEYWTPQEIAREAREALAKNPETPKEHFERMVRAGFINKRGEVTKLLGGDADPEPYAENKLPEPKRRAAPKPRKRKS